MSILPPSVIQTHSPSLQAKLIKWHHSSEGQASVLGIVFLLVFAAYLTIQAYAAKLYDEQLASDVTVALYATFTVCCFVSPTIVHMILGPIRGLVIGISGYAVLVVASLCYFILGKSALVSQWLVVAGAINGIGSSLLWTAQGLLILQYSERGVNGGKIFGIFWAFFNVSAICGGAISFLMLDNNSDTDDGDVSKVVLLFVVFLLFIIAGAFFSYFLLEPSSLFIDEDCGRVINDTLKEKSHDSSVPLKVCDQAINDTLKEKLHNLTISFKGSISKDISETLSSFRSKRLVSLSLLFFYTGYKQPYQLVTFGDRFFNEKTLGLEVMSFYLFDVIGGIITGRMLDGEAKNATPQHHRKAAIQCLVLFVSVTIVGNFLALIYEFPCDKSMISSEYWSHKMCLKNISFHDVHVILPSVSYAAWGFADSVVQTFCYWLLGLYFEDVAAQSRAVGFYVCIQSLGWTIGFLTIPTSRMSPMNQLFSTFFSMAIGTLFALFELPSPITRPENLKGKPDICDEAAKLLESSFSPNVYGL